MVSIRNFLIFSINLLSFILNTSYSSELSSVAMVMPLLKSTLQGFDQNQSNSVLLAKVIANLRSRFVFVISLSNLLADPQE